jgi:HEAT repeat protein
MSWLLPPLPPKWSAALRDVAAQRVDARIAAAKRLGQPVDAQQSAEALDALSRMSTDRDARVRAAAVEALGELLESAAVASPAEAATLPSALSQGAKLLPPIAAAEEAPSLRNAIAPVLWARLVDSDTSVRELAALGLAELGWEVAPEALADALRSEHPEVRFQALGAAARSGEPEATGKVLLLLEDPDPFVRTAAVRAAGMIEPDKRPDTMTAKLHAALRDSAYPVRSEAAIALAEAGERAAIEPLLEALSDPEHLLDALDVAPHVPDERIRERVAFMAQGVLASRLIVAAAGRALARMQDPRGLRVLRDLLSGFRSHGRTLAVQTIGELRLAELTSDLVRLSERPRAVDPSALATSLASLAPSTPAAARALQKLADRSDEYGKAARTAVASDSGFLA